MRTRGNAGENRAAFPPTSRLLEFADKTCEEIIRASYLIPH